jgi:hypothetical protein
VQVEGRGLPSTWTEDVGVGLALGCADGCGAGEDVHALRTASPAARPKRIFFERTMLFKGRPYTRCRVVHMGSSRTLIVSVAGDRTCVRARWWVSANRGDGAKGEG